ncbi:hypothetical protein BD410DRAFT_790820, partial [Rickenella mellea]
MDFEIWSPWVFVPYPLRIPTEDKQAEWNPILDILLRNSEIWRNINVMAMQPHLMDRLVSVIPKRTPMVRKIFIDAQNRLSITTLFTAPLIYLTHLTIEAPARSSPCSSGLILDNLRSLNLSVVETSDVVECLSRSPRLEEVRALITVNKLFRHESGNFRARFCLGHLHFVHLSLYMRRQHQELYFGGLFDHIDIPKLQTLRL